MLGKTVDRRSNLSPINHKMDDYRERWFLHIKRNPPKLPAIDDGGDLTDAEISYVQSCLEAMTRFYKVPLRAVAYYLRADMGNIQAWKRGIALPPRRVLIMLQWLVYELDEEKKRAEFPFPDSLFP